jgi:hypothetical protein
MIAKQTNQKAWFMVLPVFLVVAFSAVIPLMTVVNYSVQDTFGGNHVFLGGDGLVSRPDPLGTLSRRLSPPAAVFRDHPAHRDPSRGDDSPGHAEKGLGSTGLPDHHGPAAAHPLERGGHHLADLRPGRYRPARPYPRQPRVRLQLYPGPSRRLDHHHHHGCLALDQPGSAPLPTPASARYPTPTTRRRRSTGRRAGRSSATSSCRRCSGSC